jgi:hypothetical protein
MSLGAEFLNSHILPDVELNIKKRVLLNPKFSPNPPDSILLSDPVIVYNDGQKHKIISVDLLNKFPIVHDTYIDGSDISVTCCPYTMASVVYFGKYELYDKIYKNNIILVKQNTNNIIIQLLSINNNLATSSVDRLDPATSSIDRLDPATSSVDRLDPATSSVDRLPIRKIDVTIMLLINALSMFPDCLFLDMSKIIDILPMVPDDYRNNMNIYNSTKININPKFHPKTLIYGIEYYSSNMELDKPITKYTAIIGKTSSDTKTNDYNFKTNKYYNYFNSMESKIRKKIAVTIPCYWFAWIEFFPESKLILL